MAAAAKTIHGPYSDGENEEWTEKVNVYVLHIWAPPTDTEKKKNAYKNDWGANERSSKKKYQSKQHEINFSFYFCRYSMFLLLLFHLIWFKSSCEGKKSIRIISTIVNTTRRTCPHTETQRKKNEN